MKIATYQMEASISDFEARLEKIASISKDSASAGANVIFISRIGNVWDTELVKL